MNKQIPVRGHIIIDRFKSLDRRRRIALIVVALAVLAALSWYLVQRADGSNGALTASGTIEAVEVHIAPEVSGKVLQVLVDEGDAFQAGDPLFRLDDAMLKVQQEQAQAALSVAKANAAAAHANAAAQLLPAQQALDDLYKNLSVIQAEAEKAVATADRAVREATYRLENYFEIRYDQQKMTAAEGVQAMKERLDKAQAAFDPYKNASLESETRQDLKEALDQAQSDYDSAVRRQELEAALSTAQAAKEKALRDLADVQNGPKAIDVAKLKAQIDAIQAVPKQADAAVEQAQAALDLISLQLAKSNVTALNSGIVLSRGIEPGDVVQAGSPVMTVGELETLDLTVYVPEDRYGEIKLGEEAQVTVDSFPGQTFTAKVSYISDQAEFTPRNVQTVEGRKTTVYAVKLTIANTGLLLKPGMPADVQFGTK